MTKNPYVKPCLSLVALAVVGALMFVASVPQRAATQAPTPQLIESDETIVGQEGTWTAQDTPNASGGSYLYSSGSTEDVLTLNFEGTSVEIVYVQHPSFGIMAIEIDNTVVRTVDTYAENTTFDVHAEVDYLEAGPHVLRVYASSGVIAVDAFYAIPIPEPVLFFEENFDSGDLNNWIGDLVLQESLVTNGTGQALQVVRRGVRGMPRPGGIANPTLEVELKVEAGTAYFNSNESAAGSYRLAFEEDGQVTLSRGESMLGTATITYTTGQWVTVKLSKYGDVLIAYVDTIERLRVADPTPLAFGTLSISGSEDATFEVDEVRMWMPASDYEAWTAGSIPPATPSGTSTPLPSFPAGMSSASSSEDYGQIAHSCRQGSVAGYICVRDASPDNTGASELITVAGSGNLGYPDWSPDGTEIVYLRETQLFDLRYYYTMMFVKRNAEGVWESSRSILPRVGDTYIYNVNAFGTLAWSPDGDKIAFTGLDDGGLYTVDVTGCSSGLCVVQAAPITVPPSEATPYYDPTWSPDGNTLAFSSTLDGSRNIYTVSAGGGSPQSLGYSLPGDQGLEIPDWSPDGSQLAVTLHQSSLVLEDNAWAVYLIGVSQSSMEPVTNLAAGRLDTYANWSADGTQLVFSRQTFPGGLPVLYTINPDGTNADQVVGGYHPRWWGLACPEGAVRDLESGTCQPPTPTSTPTPTPTITPTATPMNPTCRVKFVQNAPGKYAYSSPVTARTERLQYLADPATHSDPVHYAKPDLPSFIVPDATYSANQILTIDGVYARDKNQDSVLTDVPGDEPKDEIDSFTARIVAVDNTQLETYLWINTFAFVAPVQDEDCSVLQAIPVLLVGRDEQLEELREYSVEVSGDVRLWNNASDHSLDQNWTDIEVSNIFNGVDKTGTSLLPFVTGASTSQDAFRAVMIQNDILQRLLFLRVETTQGNCESIPGSNDANDPRQRRIECYGYIQSGINYPTNGLVTEYAVIHELGHVFDNQYNWYLSELMGEGSSTWEQQYPGPQPPVVDCSDRYLFGNNSFDNDGWDRGWNGWGSGPALSNFQVARVLDQHQPAKTTAEVHEAAADMFLNWVYRRTASNSAGITTTSNGCSDPATGNWNGFLNKDWDPKFSNCNSSTGCNNSTALPGNRRFSWMETSIATIIP